jgi:hypothetical protein
MGAAAFIVIVSSMAFAAFFTVWFFNWLANGSEKKRDNLEEKI